MATGDLGFIGKDIMMDLLGDAGLPKKEVFEHYDDCGTMLFTKEQDVHAGGSGCGCSASVFTGHLLQQMEQGRLKTSAHVYRSIALDDFSFSGRKHTGYRPCSFFGGGIDGIFMGILIGGVFCIIGQILMDTTTLTAPEDISDIRGIWSGFTGGGAL